MSLPRSWLRVAVILLLASAPLAAQRGAPSGEWRTYGGDLGHTRYAPLDQITAANFGSLEVAWRFKTDNLGPRPEFTFQSTPLMVKGAYSTAGSRRAVVALDAATGELKWSYCRREGARGAPPPRHRFRTRSFILDRRHRGAHPLRHAGLSPHRAQRRHRRASYSGSATRASSI
jgi:quinoprotein glucose dehydrogenase